MTPRAALWLLLAIAEAMAIVLVSTLLWNGGPAAAGESPGPTPPPDATRLDVELSTEGRTQGARMSAMSAAAPPTPAGDAPAAATGAPAAPLGTLLLGTVRVRAGTLGQYTYLTLYSGEATQPRAEVSLGKLGDFAFPGLAPGGYRLTARSDGMRAFEHRFEVPAATEVVRVDVVLEPSWQVKVLLLAPDGKPLHEALAQSKTRLPESPLGEAVGVVAAWHELPAQLPTSDLRETPFNVGQWKSSRFRGEGSQLPAGCAGVLELPETRTAIVAAVMREVVLTQVPIEAGQAEVTLVVDPQQLLAQLATLRLQVVDATTGKPVLSAKVGVDDSQSWRQPSAVDAEGRFESARMRPGRYRLTILAKGYVGPPVTVDLAPGRTTDLGAVPITSPFALHIRLGNRTGDKEVSGSLMPLDAAAHAAFGRNPYDVAARNDEIQAQVWPGRYLLRLSGGGGTLVELDTRQLGSEPLRIDLTPEANLRLDSTQLAKPARLVLETPTGAVVFDRWITWKAAWEQALVPGEYRATLTSLRGESQVHAISVPAGGARFELK